MDALAASTRPAFDISGQVGGKKYAAAVPNAAVHLAAANAAVAVGKRAGGLSHSERNRLLRQVHRDEAWLLECLTDSNAALQQLHDRLAAEQKVGACFTSLVPDVGQQFGAAAGPTMTPHCVECAVCPA